MWIEGRHPHHLNFPLSFRRRNLDYQSEQQAQPVLE
jgi:hypothetical protein